MKLLKLLLALLIGASSLLDSEAQTWQELWQTAPQVSERWRHDRSHYRPVGGSVELFAPEDSRQSYISTPVPLSSRTEWSGSLSMRHRATQYNYVYILLGCIQQDTDAGTYDYLTLAFGGIGSDRITLTRMRFVVSEGIIAPDRRMRPETFATIGVETASLAEGIRYIVRLGEGKLSLYLGALNSSEPMTLISTADAPSLPMANSLGIYIAHTKTHRQGIRIGKLAIYDDWQGDTPAQPPHSDPETPAPDRPIWLSEIMANPEAGKPEYIELYNPNSVSIDLAGYSLALGSNPAKLRRLPLPEDRAIAPGQYLVLSGDAHELTSAYPSVQAESAVACPLPQLANAGVHIHLHYFGRLTDSVHYVPSRHSPGLRTRRGVSLERTQWPTEQSPMGVWRSTQGSSGHATPGMPSTSGGEGSTLEADDEATTQTLSRLISLLEQTPELAPSVYIYSAEGARHAVYRGAEGRQFVLGLAHHPGLLFGDIRLRVAQPTFVVIELNGARYLLRLLLLPHGYPPH